MTQPLTKRLPLHLAVRADGSRDYRPYYVVWEITLRCDQCCHFCGTRAGHARQDELSTDEALSVIEQLAQMGTREVAMHGGEAYLRPDWLTLVRAVRARGMDCTLVTGGRGFDLALAQKAKEAGLSAASVSIDGLEATHDALRGLKGSHSRALCALRALKEAGIAAGCNTQINRQNYRQLPDLARLLSDYGLYGWQVQLMVPMGRAAEAEELWLQPFDLLEVIPLVARTRTLADSLGIRLWPGDNIGYFGPHEHTLRTGRSLRGHAGGCGGGVVCLGLEAHGDVKACSAMSSEGFVAGNIRKDKIESLWQSSPELCFSRNFQLDDLWGYCRQCYYAEVCKGGCLWTASTLLGRRGNNPYCHHRALDLLAQGKRERLKQVQAAPGLIRDRARFELTLEDAPEQWAKAMREIEPPLAPLSD